MLSFLAPLLPLQAQNDAIVTYFDKYLNDENFTVVYISPMMFQMIGNMAGEDDPELKEAMAGLQGLRILTTEVNPQKYYKEFINTVNTKDYEMLMNVREGTQEAMQFLVKKNGDDISELLLFVGEEDEFVMLSFTGNINLNKLSQIADGLDIDVDGLEELEDVIEEQKKNQKGAK